MSKRSGGEKQEDIWIAHTELAVPPGHPFYTRLNDLLEGARFDEFVEDCVRASIMRDWDYREVSGNKMPHRFGRVFEFNCHNHVRLRSHQGEGAVELQLRGRKRAERRIGLRWLGEPVWHDAVRWRAE